MDFQQHAVSFTDTIRRQGYHSIVPAPAHTHTHSITSVTSAVPALDPNLRLPTASGYLAIVCCKLLSRRTPSASPTAIPSLGYSLGSSTVSNLLRHRIKVYPHDGHQDEDTVVPARGNLAARELLNVSNVNTRGRQYLPVRACDSTSHKLHLCWQAPVPHRASLTAECKTLRNREASLCITNGNREIKMNIGTASRGGQQTLNFQMQIFVF